MTPLVAVAFAFGAPAVGRFPELVLAAKTKCDTCKEMVVDAKAKWSAHASSSLGNKEKLQLFRTDLNTTFDKECKEKLQGDGVECAHCALCAANATVDSI